MPTAELIQPPPTGNRGKQHNYNTPMALIFVAATHESVILKVPTKILIQPEVDSDIEA